MTLWKHHGDLKARQRPWNHQTYLLRGRRALSLLCGHAESRWVAVQMGFQVGIVSNGYWATDEDDAVECLKPISSLIQDLSISSDSYHYEEKLSGQMRSACAGAEKLGVPVAVFTIAQPEETNAVSVVGQLEAGESAVMYRGRAAEKLSGRAFKKPWNQFTACPHEELRDPGRVHVDPLGNCTFVKGFP